LVKSQKYSRRLKWLRTIYIFDLNLAKNVPTRNMPMIQSCEVRWFLEALPETVAAWFERRGHRFSPEAQQGRCDFYLKSDSIRNDLNIKLREGNIEIKERTSDFGVHSFGDCVQGRVEAWRKWSFKLAQTREGGTEEALHITRQEIQNSAWIPVAKVRLLVMLEIAEEGRVRLSEAPAFSLEEGCSVELTQIRLPDRSRYSFALEAFSHSGQEYQNLLRAMDTMTAEIPGLEMLLSESMGYAEFLQS
jgi:hypothetical protein